jgi:uncharacterized protein (TIGR02246 family)
VDSDDEQSGRERSEREAIAAMTSALLRAVNASDLAGVLAVWSDDGVMMPPHHPSVHGRAAIERYFKELFEQRRLSFSFTSSHIQLSGDVAFERVEYQASISSIGNSPEARDVGKGVHVYRREPDGSWKLAVDIWNSDQPSTI